MAETALLFVEQGRVVHANAGFFRLTGLTRTAVAGHPLAELVHPEDRPTVETLVSGDCDACGRLRIPQNNGDWLSLSSEYVCNRAQGKGVGVLTFTHWDAQPKAEDRLYELVNGTQNLLYLRDQSGRFRVVNEAFARFMGMTVAEVLDQQPGLPNALRSPRGAVLEEELEVLETGAPKLLERSLTPVDGEPRWFVISLRSVQISPGDKLLVGVCTDITRRVQTETQLIRTAAELEVILDVMPDMFFRFNAHGEFLDVHSADLDQLLVPPEDFHGKTVREFMPRRIAEQFYKALDKVKETGRLQRFTYELRTNRAPRLRYYELRLSRLFEDEFIALVRDITEQERNRRRLKTTQAKFQAVVEDQNEHILVGLPDGTITFVNDALIRYYGFENEQLLGAKFPEFLDAPAWQRIEQVIRGLTPEAPTVYLEDQLLADRGDMRWQQWSIRAIYNPETHKLLRYQGVGRDITALKTTELALRRSREQYRVVINQLQEVFYKTDPHGNLQYLSPMWEELLGHRNARSLGHPIFDFLHPEDHPPFRKYLQRANTGEEFSERVDVRLLNTEGHPVWVEANVCRGFSDTGGYEGLAGTFIDISKQKLAYGSLAQAKEEAEKATKVKSQFLATVSHEIRTPLNGVLGMTALLRDTPLDTEQQELVEALERSGDHLLELLNDLLDFSKIEAGKFELVEHAFEVQPLLQDCIRLFQGRAIEKQLHLGLEIRPGVPKNLTGSADGLWRIVLNLVGNAVKFTEEGQVKVVVEYEPDTEQQGRLSVLVADTGPGIPSEKQPLLFTPFVQGNAHQRRAQSGTGLGLAISKALAEQMHGTLTLSSIFGKGSRFIFEAPFRTAQNARPKRLPKQMDRELALRVPLQILVAEDNAINRQLMEKILSRLGYAPQFAADGEEAVSAARQEEFDLILMDVQMPKMDGVAATQAILQRPNPPIVVALTAGVVQDSCEECLRAGMREVLAKPVKPVTIQQLIENLAPELLARKASLNRV